MDGIPPAPRGTPQIEVAFDIDANGILNVSAKDKATNKEQKITITGSTGLSKDEVERMSKEAEAHAEEDKQKKEEIETRNQADTLIYTTERTLKEAGDKVSTEVRTDVEQKLADVKAAQTGSVEDLKLKVDILSEAVQKVGAAMYQDQGTGTSGQAAEGGEQKTEEKTTDTTNSSEPVEGEVVEESGDKK